MKNKKWSANIIFDVGGVLFQSAHGHPRYNIEPDKEPPPDTYVPISEGIELLKECHSQKDDEGNQLHQLYILSNWLAGHFGDLQKEFPEIFSLFNGIIISGTLPFKKPDLRIYEHTLEAFKLHPGTSIFIDDFEHHVLAAEQLGITGIHYVHHELVRIKLKNLGVL